MKINWPEISKKKYGGVVYNEQVRNILSKHFEINLILCESRLFKKIRYFKIPESLFYLSRLSGKADIWIRDFYSTVTMGFDRTQGKNIVMIHHDDFSGFPPVSRPFLNLLKNLFFYKNLYKADAIVTVSEYWENHFLKKGYKNVFKIYNAFDLKDYDIKEEDAKNFKAERNLSEKPIIYLGNCQKCKGVIQAYDALKDLDAYLVTSGQPEVDIPALNFNLDHKDYLKLLKASSIVITMSKFKEGWCRTAHEAMLFKVPVIGSGSGGMTELLTGGGQIICSDFNDLKQKVEYLLNNPGERVKTGEDGFNFAKNFTLERLQKNWLDLINKILI